MKMKLLIMEACVLSEKTLVDLNCPRCEIFNEVIFGLCQKGLVCNAMELMQKNNWQETILAPRTMTWNPCSLALDLY